MESVAGDAAKHGLTRVQCNSTVCLFYALDRCCSVLKHTTPVPDTVLPVTTPSRLASHTGLLIVYPVCYSSTVVRAAREISPYHRARQAAEGIMLVAAKSGPHTP